MAVPKTCQRMARRMALFQVPTALGGNFAVSYSIVNHGWLKLPVWR